MSFITVEVSLAEFDDDDLMDELRHRKLDVPLEDFSTEELIDELSSREGLFVDPLFLNDQCRVIRDYLLMGHDDKALDTAKELCKDVLGTAT